MLNSIIIMGRLTRDPELRRTATGTAVVNFSVAVERDFAAGDGEKKTDFINCVAWRQTGEFISKYFNKGSMIAVAGRLEMRDWTDKDGSKRTSAEINVASAYFAGGKKDADSARDKPVVPRSGFVPPPYPAPAAPTHDYALLDDDDAQLPF